MIPKFRDARDSFFEHRFGLFIHWGLYAIDGWHEQDLWRRGSDRDRYENLIHVFNPVKFDPDEWIDYAEAAGMSFICFTTKHHDGFCMYDSAYTDYKITNTPYGKDILKELSDACQRRGMGLGLYYSLPDWHHPNYPNQGRHHQMLWSHPGDDPDEEKYFSYVKNQIRELMTNYGPIYQLFWDINVTEWYEPEVNEMVRQLQPGIVINDRGPGPGDFDTPERKVPDGKEFSKPTQACSALGRESWGYRIDEDYFSDRFTMSSIDRILAMGGNYLLNVGPKPDGTFPEENIASLKVIGDWFRKVGEAFDGTYPASYMIMDDVMSITARDQIWTTRKGNTLYVHIPDGLQSSGLILKPLHTLPKKATLLNTGEEVRCTVDISPWHWKEAPILRLSNLPANDLQNTIPVIKLEF